jgi:hypothetical protein
MKYTIVTNSGTNESGVGISVMNTVNKLITLEWRPLGAISVSTTTTMGNETIYTFAQALIMEEADAK